MLPRASVRDLLRELVRVAAAFGLYLVLYPLWTLSGLEGLYTRLVLEIADRIFVPTQHFPAIATLRNLGLPNFHFAPVFAVALMLVSTRVSWKLRLRRTAVVLLAILLYHVVTLLLGVKVQAAQELLERSGLLVLLPWEFRIVERLKYLFFDLGLQLVPFVLALLTFAWNSGISLGVATSKATPLPAIRRRQRVVVVAAVVAGLSISGFVWVRAREADPRHVHAHGVLGHMSARAGNEPTALSHYRAAIAGGSTDAEVYYNLAMLRSIAGRNDEAEELLRLGLVRAPSPGWRSRYDDALRRVTGRPTIALPQP